MPIIRPISELRNRAMEISKICHTENQPVFITRNGKGDMVVMSQAHYEQIQSLLRGSYLSCSLNHHSIIH